LWQNYEKLRAKQRNSFLFLPRQSNFAIFDSKDNKKSEELRAVSLFFPTFVAEFDEDEIY